MLDPAAASPVREPWLLERVRTYYAACLIALGRDAEADALVEQILRANPSASPDPVVFPGKVLDRFSDVRARIREELDARAREKADKERRDRERAAEAARQERARVAELERLARRESDVVHNSRWVALLPFGVGQFQNRQTALGWAFLGTEAALTATSMVTFVVVQSLQSQGNTPGIDTRDLNERVASASKINRWSVAALAIVAVGGIAHAQITFVPEERVVRERPLPRGPAVEPAVSLETGGGMLGLRGSF
jgi:hypothetical protein